MSAVTRQPLSLVQSESRQPNWSAEKPNSASSARAMVRGSSSERLSVPVTAWPSGCASVWALSGSTASRRSERETGTRARAARSSALSGASDGPGRRRGQVACGVQHGRAGRQHPAADGDRGRDRRQAAGDGGGAHAPCGRCRARGAACVPRCAPPVVRRDVGSPRRSARWAREARWEELTGESSRVDVRTGAAESMKQGTFRAGAESPGHGTITTPCPDRRRPGKTTAQKTPRCERNNSHHWSQMSHRPRWLPRGSRSPASR